MASATKRQVNIRPKYTFVNRTKTRVLIDNNVVLVNKINILINIEQYMMSNSVLTWNLESPDAKSNYLTLLTLISRTAH